MKYLLGWYPFKEFIYKEEVMSRIRVGRLSSRPSPDLCNWDR